MKHIISLSLKYIRRQKLRSALTFLCVTLSVFILCSFGAYMGSALQTVLNQCKREGGSYEVCINNWLNNVDDTEEALDIIKNHIVVSDYYTNLYSNTYELGKRNSDDGRITYIDFSDGINSKKISRLYEFSKQGNKELMGEMHMSLYEDNVPDGSAVVPDWLEDLGYSIGDTLTFTIQSVTAEIDEDSPEVREVRQKLLDEFGTSWVTDDAGYEELDFEIRHNSYRGTLKDAFLYYKMDLDEIPVKNEEYGEPVEFTIKIAGFESNYISDTLNIIRTDTNNFFFTEFYDKNPEISSENSLSAYIRINENIDFDDGLTMLYGALGFNESNYYSDLPDVNNDLLLFEFRSVDVIVQMLPLLILLFVLIFFAWLVARFVIDNAFEISNQERISQYASLRIMGASKTQISALVFTEALFYTVTAVPIGTVTAYLLCNMSFTSFRKMGFQDFEFKANPYFVVGGIILCIVAIFISAYTSAMWASRKLSPAEALNFGKPKKKYKKPRKRKSKINLNSKKFLRRYTNKNIMRNKGRYIISTITMTFGVLFFTFSLMLGIYFYSEIKVITENNQSYDFRLSFDSYNMLDDAEKSFHDEELFSQAKIYASRTSEIDVNATPVKEFEGLHPYNIQLS
ncbi:MAG: ABC transporter permease, partial [Ruminococcus sp.]|nr:ABC transporter permease [Ruminococcus sp.]